ncbi:MAG: hypothetical protein WC485_07385 [Opitutaceae bacterium]
MAANTVTILPIVVRFFFAQQTFIQGIATTGTKRRRDARPAGVPG